jgi:YidC/Oxa1 family membrane protein insertase
MERRMLLAVLLSFAAVTFWGMVTGKCTPPPPKEDEPPKEEGKAEPGKEEPGKGEPGKDEPKASPQDPTLPGPAPVPEPPDPQPQPAEEEDPFEKVPLERYVVQTPELEVGYVNRGGAMEFARLRNAFEPDKKTPLDLIVPTSLDNLLGQVDDTYLEPTDGAPGGWDREDDPAGWMRRIRWTRNEAAEAETEEPDVIFDVKSKTGTWRKRYVLPSEPRRYDIRLVLSYAPDPGQATTPVAVKVLVSAGLLREPDTGATFQEPNSLALRLSMESDPTFQPYGLPLPTADQRPNDLRVLAQRSAFHLAGYYEGEDEASQPDVVRWWGTGEVAEERPRIQEHVASFFLRQYGRDWEKDPQLKKRIEKGVKELHYAWLVVNVPAEGGKVVDLPLYLGPIDRHVLNKPPYVQLDSVISYRAAPDILADALLAIYDLFLGIFGNAGVAVILMTLVVRGAMMPLSIKNQLSMRVYSRKIAKVKPKLDALKQKYGSNLKRMREEQAKLYREHGIGFPTGCLMLFIQLPIFFALFASLRTEYTLRNSVFLWIQDLSGPDKLIDFGGAEFSLLILTVFSINILPLIMVALSIWQQRMMPKPADEQQAQQMRMMKWLPIIFAVILYNYTAALSLYMVLSSAVAILESRIVRSKDAGSGDGAPAEWPKKTEAATT